MKKNFEFYRGLPYTRRCQLIVEAERTYWHAWIEELSGCEVDGASKAEAYASLQELFEDYIHAKLEWRSDIPEPSRWPDYGTTASNFQEAMTVVPFQVPTGLVETVQESQEDVQMTAVAA
ncbi:MAG TPA: hypothetical protein VGA37_09335 [Gemmatimonadales bacterium]